ncbi:MAG: lipopolysaccharide kinase InaA family protein [Planctomycetota bacterium]
MSVDERFVEGAWSLSGRRELFSALAGELESHAARATKWRARLTLGDEDVFLKGSPLLGRAALRHALARALLGREEPRRAEFANLRWLRAHGFRAPEPCLAGVRRGGGIARYQFLVTGWVPAPRLDQFLAQAGPPERAAALRALGASLARLHALGFVHRDLFARNLLVEPGPELVYLDAWRGGPARGLRGPLHDLACLMLDGAQLFTAAEQRLLFGTYRAQSPRRLAPDLLRAVARARARLLPRERRRHPELAPEWNFLDAE